ncbi:unnamed protein product [Oikopleura dioica]|uniref:Uncharacterized protein n=1 Tax=Oikopleura dioica TaxID=34765 RepID=E4X178_OIKDI|nr:unnamed protein product [Oikopleura dioica]
MSSAVKVELPVWKTLGSEESKVAFWLRNTVNSISGTTLIETARKIHEKHCELLRAMEVIDLEELRLENKAFFIIKVQCTDWLIEAITKDTPPGYLPAYVLLGQTVRDWQFFSELDIRQGLLSRIPGTTRINDSNSARGVFIPSGIVENGCVRFGSDPDSFLGLLDAQSVVGEVIQLIPQGILKVWTMKHLDGSLQPEEALKRLVLPDLIDTKSVSDMVAMLSEKRRKMSSGFEIVAGPYFKEQRLTALKKNLTKRNQPNEVYFHTVDKRVLNWAKSFSPAYLFTNPWLQSVMFLLEITSSREILNLGQKRMSAYAAILDDSLKNHGPRLDLHIGALLLEEKIMGAESSAARSFEAKVKNFVAAVLVKPLSVISADYRNSAKEISNLAIIQSGAVKKQFQSILKAIPSRGASWEGLMIKNLGIPQSIVNQLALRVENSLKATLEEWFNQKLAIGGWCSGNVGLTDQFTKPDYNALPIKLAMQTATERLVLAITGNFSIAEDMMSELFSVSLSEATSSTLPLASSTQAGGARIMRADSIPDLSIINGSPDPDYPLGTCLTSPMANVTYEYSGPADSEASLQTVDEEKNPSNPRKRLRYCRDDQSFAKKDSKGEQ